MRPRISLPTSSGFTLVEVMVSLIVISVGLLGIASMQALALSSSNNARLRSLAAIEASSLAATMHTNRSYWSSSVPGLVTVIDGTITGGTLNVVLDPGRCEGGDSCTPEELAAYDLQKWTASLDSLLPHPSATITCPILSVPMSCSIKITWTESVVAMTKQEAQSAAATAGFKTPDYTLYVQP